MLAVLIASAIWSGRVEPEVVEIADSELFSKVFAAFSTIVLLAVHEASIIDL